MSKQVDDLRYQLRNVAGDVLDLDFLRLDLGQVQYVVDQQHEVFGVALDGIDRVETFSGGLFQVPALAQDLGEADDGG